MKLVIAGKETDEENPFKYLATNKIDASTQHVIRSDGMRWRIETFLQDSKQDLGLGTARCRPTKVPVERIDKEEREIDEETYRISTKTLPVSKLGEVRLVIAEKVTDDDDEENPVKYLVTNKVDAPSAHIIRTYSYRWRIETFFEDSKQNLGLDDCEVRDSDGASRHWHLQMLTYILIRLGPESSPSERLVSKASSLHTLSRKYMRIESVY